MLLVQKGAGKEPLRPPSPHEEHTLETVLSIKEPIM